MWCSRDSPGLPFTQAVPTSIPSVKCAAGRGRSRSGSVTGASSAVRKPSIFASHSPPFGLGDQEDVAHVGFESFLDLIDRYHPPLWLHGHVHLYGPDQERVRQKGDTKIVNVYGHRILDV